MKLLAIAILLLLAGCVTQPPVDPKIAEEAARPLTCANKQQCDFYWQRAQAWVNKNSRFRIQAVTDTVLSTYHPSEDDHDLGYQLTRVPNADGSGTIEIELICGPDIFYKDNPAFLRPLGCRPDPITETYNLKRFVRGQ